MGKVMDTPMLRWGARKKLVYDLTPHAHDLLKAAKRRPPQDDAGHAAGNDD